MDVLEERQDKVQENLQVNKSRFVFFVTVLKLIFQVFSHMLLTDDFCLNKQYFVFSCFLY